MDVALYTLIITTIAALLAQVISMFKSDKAARAAAEMFRLESEERRKDAAMLIEQTRADAVLLASQTEKHASNLARTTETNRKELAGEVKRVAAVAKDKTEEIKVLVTEAAELTKDGTRAAQNAFHEANQVNMWRSEVNEEIRRLAQSLENMLLTAKDAKDAKDAQE